MLKRIHKAWFILAAVCVTYFVCAGFSTSVTGLFFTTISASVDGISYGQLSFSTTVQSMVLTLGIAAGPLVARKVSVKKLMIVETFLFAGCLFASSFFSKTWQWIAIAVIIGQSQAFLGSFIITFIVANWFKEKYSFAMGLIFVASNLSGVVLNPVMSFIIRNLGWRSAYRIEAIVTVIILLPMFCLVIRVKPSDVGMHAYGESQGTEESSEQDLETVSRQANVSASNPVRISLLNQSIVFYLFCIATVTGTLLCCFAQHIISATLSIGLNYELGVAAVTFSMIISTLFNLIGGALLDRFGYLKVCTLYFGCSAVGMAILLAQSSIGAGAFFTAIGFIAIGHSLVYTSMPSWIKSEFPLKYFGRMYSILQVISWVVYAVAISGFGFIYDTVGNYTPVFWMIAVAAVVTDGMIILAYCLARRLNSGSKIQDKGISNL